MRSSSSKDFMGV